MAHKIYGEASTINSANYVMFIALERVIALGHPAAVSVYTEQMLELHRGQGMEIYWRDNFRYTHSLLCLSFKNLYEQNFFSNISNSNFM